MQEEILKKSETEQENKKNVVVIIIDALRTKNLSMFGYEKETDKYLKQIAKESIVFHECFSASNATAPSLSALFTGRYPNHNGVIHQFPYTSEEEIKKIQQARFWFPSFLKNRGYETIGVDWIGLWLKRGFNQYQEKEEKSSWLREFMKKPGIKKFLLSLPNWVYKIGKKVVKTRASAAHASAKVTTDLAISKVLELDKDKPFFLFVHFWDTHFPFKNTKYQAREEEEDVEEVLVKIKSKNQREYFKKRITDIGLNSIKDMKNKYDETIMEIDKNIGRFVKFMKEQGLWEDCVFMVMGDHGDSLDEHGIYFSHSGLFDESIHVPLIMKIPGIKAEENKELVQNVDIIPTLVEYLKLKNEHGEKFDGKSFLDLLKTGKPIRDKIFAFDGLAVDIKTARTKKRKIIVAKNAECNLCKAKHHEEIEEYDLEKDPAELNNLRKKV